jgi:hypothetical protein
VEEGEGQARVEGGVMAYQNMQFIHNPYEVVKTVGFEVDGQVKSGAFKRIRYQLDVIRLFGSDEFTAVLWQLHDEMGNLLALSVEAGGAAVHCRTVDEVVEAVLKAMNSGGAIPPASPSEQVGSC